MPIYEYRCGDCEQIFEEWQTGFEERELPCPVCGGKSRRLISNTSFVLKGTGWYTTDYCSTSSGNGGNGGKAGNANGNGNGSKSAADAKESSDSAKTTASGGTESASSGTASTSSDS